MLQIPDVVDLMPPNANANGISCSRRRRSDKDQGPTQRKWPVGFLWLLVTICYCLKVSLPNVDIPNSMLQHVNVQAFPGSIPGGIPGSLQEAS